MSKRILSRNDNTNYFEHERSMPVSMQPNRKLYLSHIQLLRQKYSLKPLRTLIQHMRLPCLDLRKTSMGIVLLIAYSLINYKPFWKNWIFSMTPIIIWGVSIFYFSYAPYGFQKQCCPFYYIQYRVASNYRQIQGFCLTTRHFDTI